MENGSAAAANGGPGVPPHKPPAAPVDSDSKADPGHGGHKRSLSGSILAKLPFYRPSSDEVLPPTPQPEHHRETDSPEDGPARHGGGSAMANAMRQSKGRKRKGSLRKTAILGTGKMRLEGRERRNSLVKPDTQQRASLPPKAGDNFTDITSRKSLEDDQAHNTFGYNGASPSTSSEGGWSEQQPQASTSLASGQKLTLDTTTKPAANQLLSPDDARRPSLTSPVTSPTNAYVSTTDDDEGMTFSRPSTVTATHAQSAYFPLQQPGPASSLQRRRSNNKSHPVHTSPLALPPSSAALEDEWDYSETAWWGWVVLIVTWIVFVVGMGSCLGVWSWAWDVGETPYAPPELEDDPTLPVVGYYPALIILTAVMAWVWVVVAWVGMKYFRHAKMVGEEG